MISLEGYKKIGILGGTFNPIHVGHLLMAEYAKEVADLDVVMVMPSGISYLKANTNVLPGKQRLEMVELSIENNPNLISSDIEINREGNTYTYETLQQLKGLYPNAEFYFIVGADSLFSIERWVKPELIFQNCTLLAAGRNNAAKEELVSKKLELEYKFAAKILLMDFPEIDISSTKIRENVRAGRSIRYMVHEEVRKYIQDNGLYKNQSFT